MPQIYYHKITQMYYVRLTEMVAPWKKNCDKPRQHIKKQRNYFANKGLSSEKLWFFQESCMNVRGRL